MPSLTIHLPNEVPATKFSERLNAHGLPTSAIKEASPSAGARLVKFDLDTSGWKAYGAHLSPAQLHEKIALVVAEAYELPTDEWFTNGGGGADGHSGKPTKSTDSIIAIFRTSAGSGYLESWKPDPSPENPLGLPLWLAAGPPPPFMIIFDTGLGFKELAAP